MGDLRGSSCRRISRSRDRRTRARRQATGENAPRRRARCGGGRRPRSQGAEIAPGDFQSRRGSTSLVPAPQRATDQSHGRRQRVVEEIQPIRRGGNLPRASGKQTSRAGGKRSRYLSIRSGEYSAQLGADYRILSAAKLDSETVRGG